MTHHPPAIVRTAADLRVLAGEINAAHRAGEDAGRRGLEQFKEAGVLLLKAKEHVGHGQWESWIQTSLRFSVREAQRYMRLAREWLRVATLPSLTEALCYLTQDKSDMHDAFGGSAKPPVPDEVRFTRQVENLGTSLEEIAALKGKGTWYPQLKKKYDELAGLWQTLAAVPTEAPLQLPASLETPEFRQVWQEWLQHRKEKRARLTLTAIRKQLEMFAEWGPAKATLALNKSLIQGYQGVFDPDE